MRPVLSCGMYFSIMKVPNRSNWQKYLPGLINWMSLIIPELLKDVTDFLTQLTAMGMITEDLHLISSIPSVSMIIAGICIKLYGSAELISPNFKPFLS